MRIERHKSGVWVREDGCVFVPKAGRFPARWTFGTRNCRAGYLSVCVNRKHLAVHRIVAETFIPNNGGLPTVDHIDGNTTNNSVENLRWATYTTQNSNKACVRASFRKYGVRSCSDRPSYNKAYTAARRAAGFRYLTGPDGKQHWVKQEDI